ncbi:hypothetical protein HMPREF1863_01666 [Aedoeadaptatus coxii]|uniref:Uncharacterized protein n=1 Tax=Aedoeadaptatus coxii TaxID=755172 RepID=A0A134ABW6_9FIRM|nr:hypothetical protein HMPREF1863_01666 [Peptoniphilus coxii]
MQRELFKWLLTESTITLIELEKEYTKNSSIVKLKRLSCFLITH